MKERPSVLPELDIYQLRKIRDILWDRRGEVIALAGTGLVNADQRVKLNARFKRLMVKSSEVEDELEIKERVGLNV